MLSVCILYKKGENINDWRNSLPKKGIQVVACQTIFDETAKEIKKEIIGKTDELIGLQITFPTLENDFDFSMCRNFLDEHAERDWILHIDSDEKLATPHNEFWEIMETLDKSDADCGFVSIAGISNEEEPTEVYRPRYNLPNLRLHRKSSNLKWEGICHENLTMDKPGLTIADTDILLNHSGYAIDKNEMLKKCERNGKLMVREYTRDKTERNWKYLVSTFSLIHKLLR